MPWLNGAICDAAAGCIAADDRGFTLGDGVFETMRVQAGRVLRHEAHLRRLRDGAAVLGIPVRYSDEALAQAMDTTLAAHGIRDGSLRLTLSRGPAPRGLATPAVPDPTLLIVAAPSVPPSGGPTHVVTALGTRRNEWSPLSRIKSLNYLDSILARREAERLGAGDAILLNTQARAAGATGANLIVLSDGALLTPPVEDGALPGITRGVLIGAGLIRATPLGLAALAGAEAMFLCNSLGIRCIASLDGRALAVRDDLVRRFEATIMEPWP